MKDPIIVEIPYLRNKDDISYDSTDSVRSVLSESIRMLISNLKFLSLNDKKIIVKPSFLPLL